MLIAFEGGEGSGKGTQIKLLEHALKKDGFNVSVIREPGGTAVGQAIRNVLLDQHELKIDGLTEAFLYSASRAQQVREVTRPLIQDGVIVLSDRSFISTYAYQGYARGYDIEILMKLTEIAVGETIPDIFIYLDIDPDVGIERKKTQNEVNRLDKESLDFHKQVRYGYKELGKKFSGIWHEFDGAESPNKIHEKILKLIRTKLN